MNRLISLGSAVAVFAGGLATIGGCSSASSPLDGFGGGGADSTQTDAGGAASADASGAAGDGAAGSEDAPAGSPGADSGGPGDGATAPRDGSGGDERATGPADGAGPSRDGATPPAGDGASVTYPAFAASGGSINDGLAQLNRYRALVGLGAVTLDAPSSAGCAAHLQYLMCAAAAGGGMGYLEHTETGFPQCASDGGAQAGLDSDLSWGESTSNRQVTGQSFGQAVDDWINGLYHRTPLLDPGLTKIGAASVQGYNCLDYGAAGNTVSARAATPVLFPPDGTTDVPDTFEGNEGPCPTVPANPLTATTCAGSGFIVSANFYGWTSGAGGTGRGGGSAISAVASATLTDMTSGAAVPLLTYYADTVAGHDPAPGYVRNEIALVPQASLAAGHTFGVSIAATVSGQATTLAWQFTTGSRAP